MVTATATNQAVRNCAEKSRNDRCEDNPVMVSVMEFSIRAAACKDDPSGTY